MTSTYTPRHPEIFEYTPRFLDPALLRGDRTEIFTEPAEQIFLFRLFTPEFCALLVEEAEYCAKWRTEADLEDHPYTDIAEVSEPDTTQHLSHMPGLESVYDMIVRQHLQPLIVQNWPTFKLQKISPPYILKYSADAIRSMALHHDLETVTLVVYLNEEFTGGGTHFPRWNYHTGTRESPSPRGGGICFADRFTSRSRVAGSDGSGSE